MVHLCYAGTSGSSRPARHAYVLYGTGPLRIGMVATLESYKDQPTLLRAAAMLRRRGLDVRVQLVGSGPQAATLRRLAGQLQLGRSVDFAGTLDRRQVRAAIHSWDVLVHATRAEGMSIAVLEGMATARPIVAGDVHGVRELIADGQTGLLVGESDVEALAAALRKLAAEPDLAERLGEAARDLAERHYSARRMAEAYENFGDKLLN
ncbi:MAG: glycosyltransferase [Planctomycetota bacterium]|nr:glycosyltransferase [Planctomycetota bacterium]